MRALSKYLLTLHALLELVGRDGLEPSTNWLKGIWPFQPIQQLGANHFTELSRFRASVSADFPGIFTEISGARKAVGATRALPFWLLAWHLIFGIGALYAVTVGTARAPAQDVYLDPDGRVGTHHEESIRFAVWVWNQSLGTTATQAGYTISTVPAEITFKTATQAEWDAFDAPAGTRAVTAYDEYAPIRTFEIFLHPTQEAPLPVIVHELGHALGAWRHASFDTWSLMYSNPRRPFVTSTDIGLVSNDWWPRLRPGSRCHTTVAPNLDIYIPSIGGKRAFLDYIGWVDGYRTWSVAQVDTVGASACANNTLHSNGAVTINDVRSVTQNYASAGLEPHGGNWRLTSLTVAE